MLLFFLSSLFCSSLLISRHNTRSHFTWMVFLRSEATEDLDKCFSKADLMCHDESHFIYGFLNGHYSLLHSASACSPSPHFNHQYNKSHLLYSTLKKKTTNIPNMFIILLMFPFTFTAKPEICHSLYLWLRCLHLCCEEFQLFQKSYFLALL